MDDELFISGNKQTNETKQIKTKQNSKEKFHAAVLDIYFTATHGIVDFSD